MKLYAETPARRTRQITTDLLSVLWIVLWVRLAGVVHHATLALAVPGRRLQHAGGGLSARLHDAAAAVASLPFVGDSVRKPFDGAGHAATQLARAGAVQAAAVTHLAWWLAVVVGALPVLLVLVAYLPSRIRFVLRASAVQRLLARSPGDVEDLLALRSLAHQPLRRLTRVADDPAAAWRGGDPETLRALAALELRDAGLDPRRQPGAWETGGSPT